MIVGFSLVRHPRVSGGVSPECPPLGRPCEATAHKGLYSNRPLSDIVFFLTWVSRVNPKEGCTEPTAQLLYTILVPFDQSAVEEL